MKSITRSIAQPITVGIGASGGGGAAFAFSSYFAGSQYGSAWTVQDAVLWQEVAQSNLADADTDPVGYIEAQAGGSDLSQATSAARPLLDITGNVYSLNFDASDDYLQIASLASFTGGCVMIAGENGIWIDNAHDHAGGAFNIGKLSGVTNSYTGGPDGVLALVGKVIGVFIRDEAVTDAEKAAIFAEFKAKGAPGYFELGSELVVNGGFDADTDWNKGSGWAISGGKAVADGSNAGSSYLTSVASAGEAGADYLLSVEVSNYTSGKGRINWGGLVGAFINTNKTASFIGTLGSSGQMQLQLWDAGSQMDWDNYSIKKLTLVSL